MSWRESAVARSQRLAILWNLESEERQLKPFRNLQCDRSEGTKFEK